MEYFRLNHSLQLQYDGFFKKFDREYVSRDIYAINEDVLIAVGQLNSICISLQDGSETVLDDFSCGGLTDESLAVISHDKPADELMRYILMRMRAALKIEPYANLFMLSVLRNKINEQLKEYNVMIKDNDELLPILCAQVYGIDRNAEFILAYLMMGNYQTEDNRRDDGFDLQYTKRLMGLMRYEEALELFLKELNKYSPASMKYTELCMYIGEIYYHLEMRENSLKYYMQCDEHYVNDVNDYYSRIGHSILDDGSGLRGNLIRMYYRCLLNPTYMKSIEDKYDRLVEQVKPLYDEYEARCVEVGRNEVIGY